MSSTPPQLESRSCALCQHFDNNPASIELAFPGMRAMGSGYASVTSGDGLCRRHDLYLAATDSCPDFLPRPCPARES